MTVVREGGGGNSTYGVMERRRQTRSLKYESGEAEVVSLAPPQIKSPFKSLEVAAQMKAVVGLNPKFRVTVSGCQIFNI